MSTHHTHPRRAASAVEPPGGHSEVRAFLARIARALTAGDGKTVAGMWAVPALVLGDDDVRAVGTLQEVEQFFGGAKEQYNARGIVDTRADILELKWLTPRIALVEVRWPYLDQEGNEVGEEVSTYALRRDETGALKVQVALMQGAAREG
jgi:uncharacterized NTF2-like protein DUF6841